MQPEPLRDFGGALNQLLRRMLALPEQAAVGAAELDALHYFQILTFAFIGFVVLVLTAVFIVRGVRRSRDESTPRVVAPLWLELGIAGGLLSFFILWWVLGFRQYVDRIEAPADAELVYVTGRQWVWTFEREDGRTSTGVLYVPVDRPIRLLLASRDVIHSFFVPAFRVKMDAVPGRWTTTWFQATEPGRHRVLCAEYCGAGHSRMWGEVVALSREDYERWVDGVMPRTGVPGTLGEPQVLAPDSGAAARSETLADRGVRIAAEHGCLQCHSVDGSDHIGPTWRGLFGRSVPLEAGDTAIADPAYLTESMMDPEAEIVRGYPPVMPSYHGLLTPSEVAALVEFIRALREPGSEAQVR